jgi:hypothetical protein
MPVDSDATGADQPATPVPFVPTPTEDVQVAVDSPSAEEGPASGDPAFGFKQALVLALSAPPRDYAALTTYMSDSFEIMIWYGNGEQMPPAQAATSLENAFLPPGNTLTFVDNPDYEALIGGNPFQFYVGAYDFLFARGWGSSGNDEAILTISEEADGSYTWSGILYANDGFAANPPPQSASGWMPLPEGICTDLRDSVGSTLGAATVTLEMAAPFDDYIGGTSGTGCLISVPGTGADFAGHSEVFAQLEGMLTTMGWTRDINYDGGGPTGTLGGFRRDSALILVLVGWEPSADANCPQDQPIFACDLAPEQKLYTITLSAAMQ